MNIVATTSGSLLILPVKLGNELFALPKQYVAILNDHKSDDVRPQCLVTIISSWLRVVEVDLEEVTVTNPSRETKIDSRREHNQR